MKTRLTESQKRDFEDYLEEINGTSSILIYEDYDYQEEYIEYLTRLDESLKALVALTSYLRRKIK